MTETPAFFEQAVAPDQRIIGLFDRYVMPTYKRSLVLERGQGVRVWDVNGKAYLDMGGGIAVNSLGHAHPAMVAAVRDQAARLIHTSNLYYTEPQGQLARRLVELTGSGRIFFCNSGAEANECLFKLARKFGHETGRYGIITTTNSFHGRTLAGIAATGQDKVKKGFEPMMAGFTHVPYNDLDAVARALTPETAAVLIEGIQGEGGVVPATPDYLLGLRELTRRHGVLLLMDAVQCGFFRSGRFQSFQRILENHPGGETFLPDGISMAKSLGGGFPIGATWISEPLTGLLGPGSHGTTYGGTPLACAVALAVLEVVEKENLALNIRTQGDRLLAGLRRLVEQGKIKAARGMGGLIGAAVHGNHLETAQKMAAHGLLLVPAGTDTLRFLPPLNVTASEIDEALDLFEKNL
jgi:acetylornithine aminotransferase/acetylornithine/N-succinyldiaminopimelate aminotransferase